MKVTTVILNCIELTIEIEFIKKWLVASIIAIIIFNKPWIKLYKTLQI